MFLCVNINFIIICSLTNFNKNRISNWKIISNFEEVITNTWTTHNQNFPALGTLVLELLDSMFLCINRNFIIICSLMDFNKNWTNNWKNIKLWWSHYQYLNNPQLKLPCFRHFGSWVIRLNVSMYKYKLYNYMLFDGLKKTGTNNWKNTKLWGSHYQSLSTP